MGTRNVSFTLHNLFFIFEQRISSVLAVNWLYVNAFNTDNSKTVI